MKKKYFSSFESYKKQMNVDPKYLSKHFFSVNLCKNLFSHINLMKNTLFINSSCTLNFIVNEKNIF